MERKKHYTTPQVEVFVMCPESMCDESFNLTRMTPQERAVQERENSYLGEIW